MKLPSTSPGRCGCKGLASDRPGHWITSVIPARPTARETLAVRAAGLPKNRAPIKCPLFDPPEAWSNALGRPSSRHPQKPIGHSKAQGPRSGSRSPCAARARWDALRIDPPMKEPPAPETLAVVACGPERARSLQAPPSGATRHLPRSRGRMQLTAGAGTSASSPVCGGGVAVGDGGGKLFMTSPPFHGANSILPARPCRARLVTVVRPGGLAARMDL